MRIRQQICAILKTAFGTDTEAVLNGVEIDMGRKPETEDGDGKLTEKKAAEAEASIHEMKAATRRLAELKPAANLTEALQQIGRE